MTRRIEFTVPEELGERYDQARGLIPMATWLKAIVAEKLNGSPNPALLELERGLAEHHARTSADAKRAVRPIPKGKR